MFHVEHSITMHKYAKIMYKYTERKGQAAGCLKGGSVEAVAGMAAVCRRWRAGEHAETSNEERRAIEGGSAHRAALWRSLRSLCAGRARNDR